MTIFPVIWSELESDQPLEFFKLALIHLSYPTGNFGKPSAELRGFGPGIRSQKRKTNHLDPKVESLRSLSFPVNFLHDVAIIMHVHEEVLAPFAPCLSIVTENYALELYSQRTLAC